MKMCEGKKVINEKIRDGEDKEGRKGVVEVKGDEGRIG